MNNSDDEPLLDIARGDPALSHHLLESLKTLRWRSDDDQFKHLVDDVLAGRKSLREVAFTSTFERALNTGVSQFAERYEQMSEEERQSLADEGEQQLQKQREAFENQKAGAANETDEDGDDPDDAEWRNFLR